MGQEIASEKFSEQDYQHFQEKLLENLQGLKCLLSQPDFGVGSASIGAELELYLIDQQARPLLLNKEVISRCDHKQLALELNRFNLEYNLTPVPAAGTPFTRLEEEMKYAIELVTSQLQEEQGRALPIGILPTLKRSDFGLQVMTDESRFFALTKALQRLRGGMFCIKIDGDPPISLRSNDVTLEGANSSMQVHFRVNPERFACTFNALQLVTPVVLALAANSPFMLGHKLWHETRIPLFRQAIDGRSHDECDRGLPSRVDFGNGWVREGAYELFAESVRLYEPILPVVSEEDVASLIKQGKTPKLNELCLHTGTVWPWNRAVYDSHDGGHVRVEMRALPAGPTPCDMVTNAAFALGVAKGLQEQMDEIIPAMPFTTLARNFYLAAERGVNADLMWPDLNRVGGLVKKSVLSIAEEIIPIAYKGLKELGVDDKEADYYLVIMKQRINSGMTGALWQRREFQRLVRKMPDHAALTRMMQRYMDYSAENVPVSEWVNRDER
ncbi:glutamate-cysteine ligase family protein [Neptuniibacter sp.]|uniref:glutamate-cysteine ligase family protein n=1 Tax=Neptuniibacter sp. TaxID=1962643 RepID=UPI002616E2CD|nr:glutamate-cysteine ligase family protein [Neptuniibacter sp.]MCP4596666.1 glutamate--cysteine ligase [Neptuniibacter sp.]